MDILKYEKTYQSRGYNNIAGIDEAGRGPLAGPVVAVSVNWGDSPLIEGVKDSKKISEKKRKQQKRKEKKIKERTIKEPT